MINRYPSRFDKTYKRAKFIEKMIKDGENQMESKASETNDGTSEISSEINSISFDEVTAIVQSGDSDKLREVIEIGRVSGINIRCNRYIRSCWLMMACRGGFIECAKVLLEHNADVNYRTYDGRESVLKSACLRGNTTILNLIIERGIRFTDNILLDLFGLVKIVRNTEIATILVRHIQNVNFYREEDHDFLYATACVAESVVISLILV